MNTRKTKGRSAAGLTATQIIILRNAIFPLIAIARREATLRAALERARDDLARGSEAHDCGVFAHYADDASAALKATQ